MTVLAFSDLFASPLQPKRASSPRASSGTQPTAHNQNPSAFEAPCVEPSPAYFRGIDGTPAPNLQLSPSQRVALRAHCTHGTHGALCVLSCIWLLTMRRRPSGRRESYDIVTSIVQIATHVKFSPFRTEGMVCKCGSEIKKSSKQTMVLIGWGLRAGHKAAGIVAEGQGRSDKDMGGNGIGRRGHPALGQWSFTASMCQFASSTNLQSIYSTAGIGVGLSIWRRNT